MAALLDGTTEGADGIPPPNFLPSDVDSQREREGVAAGLRPFLKAKKIDKEALRDELQRVTIKALIDALETNKPNEVKDNVRLLAEISGMKAQKILVEATKRRYTKEDLDAFRLAGKGGEAPQIQARDAAGDSDTPGVELRTASS